MKLPPYTTFPSISGDRILLREIQATDIEDLIEISFYDGVQAKSVLEATEMQAKINSDYQSGNSIHWGIEDKFTNKIVGTCGYYRGFENEAGELGCVLLPQFRGQGFMTDAMVLAMEFGQNSLELRRIWARTNQDNAKAMKLLERLNFIKVVDLDGNEV